MAKYNQQEQEFLDKAAIAVIQGMVSSGQHPDTDYSCRVAINLLIKRKKLFNDE